MRWAVLVLVACSRPAAVPDVAAIALTPTEYNNTVRDLLGMPASGLDWPDPPAVAAALSPSDGELSGVFSAAVEPPPWPWVFPDEPGVHGYDGFADGQEPSAYGVEQLQGAAVRYGAYTLVSPTFFTCEGWAGLPEAEQEACGWSSIARLAQRAWRRPTRPEEEERLRAFWEAAWAGGSPEEAIAVVAAGILQSPAFVFRLERGVGAPDARGVVALDAWELASRLSYFLWDSMPDPVLFAAADSGELLTPRGLRDQVERMLADPRARSAVVHFHRQMMETDAVLQIAPSQRAYGPVFGLDANPALDTTDDGAWPGVLGPLRHSLLAEEALFVESVVFDGEGTLEGLLTSNRGFVSDQSRVLYGPDVVVDESTTIVHRYGNVAASIGTADARLALHPAVFPQDQRAGLLTMPSVLAVGAYPVHPAPILRGKRIMERLLCTELGSPPPGAEGAAPPDSVEAETTNRARTESATSPSSCVGCHNLLNPPGFAFENFDALGRWRGADNGIAVDATGRFSPGWAEADIVFDGPTDLAQQLAVHPVVRDCYALRWTEYAVGAALGEAHPSVIEVQEAFRGDDDVLGLLKNIATSPMFRHRQVEVEP